MAPEGSQEGSPGSSEVVPVSKKLWPGSEITIHTHTPSDRKGYIHPG